MVAAPRLDASGAVRVSVLGATWEGGIFESIQSSVVGRWVGAIRDVFWPPQTLLYRKVALVCP